MKLFHSAGACSQASYIMIQEMGIPCDIIKVDFADRTELLKFNPRGQVPTLVLDDGKVLTEGAVILQYLADLKPEMNFLPKVGTWERYKTLESLNYVATELHKTLGALFVKDLPADTKNFFTAAAGKKLAYLNTHLAQNQFMAAAQYTAADMYCFTVVSWTKWVGIDMTPYPNVLAYCERIATRPAVLKAIQADSAK